MILDTNVIIYYIQRDPKVELFMMENLNSITPLYISVVSVTELLGFPKLDQIEAEAIEKILSTLAIIPIETRIARIAGVLHRLYGLKLADSLIASTALSMRVPLVTRNINDFKKIGQLTIHEV